MSRSYKVPLALLILTQGSMSVAQSPSDVVKWSAALPSSKSLKPGAKLITRLEAKIKDGWHVYSITQPPGGPAPTIISVPRDQALRSDGEVTGTQPRSSYDPNFQMETQYYEESVRFRVPLAVYSSAKSGPANSVINVRFQTCDDRVCLPPATVHVRLSATVADSNRNIFPVTKQAPSPLDAFAPGGSTIRPVPAFVAAPSPETAPTSRSLLSFLWLAVGFGALSLLTPCVFPMIPITVSYFTNHAAGHRTGAVRDAFIYALGIVLTFTALGVALAALFGAAGINKFAANPWINLAITAIFIGFAMSLLGSFNLQVPSSVLTKLAAVSRSKESTRFLGLLVMGLTFSLTSFTCTAPFVGTLLVMAAQGKWVYPIIGMLAFSTVFALPFFVLALVPQLVSQLPKSGGWLNSVKVVMGLLEIAAAMKFLSNVDLVWHWGIFTRDVVLAIWLAVALLITLYLLGKFQLPHDSRVEDIGAVRLLTSLATLAFGFYLLTGLLGHRLGELESFLPPDRENSSSAALAAGNDTGALTANGELTWITNDYEGALNRAKTENKPVFIDFTGYTCTNCRWMEVNMFTKGAVKEELARYVRVRLYTDGEGQPYEAFQQMQQKRFGTVALPLYAVINGDGNTLTTFPGLTRDSSEFVSFLKTGQVKFAPSQPLSTTN
jgi:thiol:disulfide interchange protein